jgi:hypothetical protein
MVGEVAEHPVRVNPIAPESRIIVVRANIFWLPYPYVRLALLSLSAIQPFKRAKSLQFHQMLKQEV